MMSCSSNEYMPVDDIKEYETYNIFATSYGDYIINNKVYEIRIYKDVDKVTMFNSTNHSKCTIYKRKNFIDNTSEIKQASNGQEYKVYDIEFDLIIPQKDGTEKLENYKIYIDMNPEPTKMENGKYTYGKRELTITADDGTVTVIDNNSVLLQLIESIGTMSE